MTTNVKDTNHSTPHPTSVKQKTRLNTTKESMDRQKQPSQNTLSRADTNMFVIIPYFFSVSPPSSNYTMKCFFFFSGFILIFLLFLSFHLFIIFSSPASFKLSSARFTEISRVTTDIHLVLLKYALAHT